MDKKICDAFTTRQKKKEITLLGTAGMDLELIMLSEIRKSEKDKFRIISLIWGIMNQLNKQAN